MSDPRDPVAAVFDQVIAAGAPWSAVLKAGQVLRIVDLEGQQAVDALFYGAGTGRALQHAGYVACPRRALYRGLALDSCPTGAASMARITADTCGRHDTSAGCCSCESNAVRFGESTKYQHACRENFILELSRYGLAKRDIVPT